MLVALWYPTLHSCSLVRVNPPLKVRLGRLILPLATFAAELLKACVTGIILPVFIRFHKGSPRYLRLQLLDCRFRMETIQMEFPKGETMATRKPSSGSSSGKKPIKTTRERNAELKAAREARKKAAEER